MWITLLIPCVDNKELSSLLILTNIYCSAGVCPLPHNHHMTYTAMIRVAHKEKIEINEPSKMIINHLSSHLIGPELVRWSECWPLIGPRRRTNNCLGRVQYCPKYLFSVFFYHHMDLQYANTLIHWYIPHHPTQQQIRYIFNIYFVSFYSMHEHPPILLITLLKHSLPMDFHVWQ